jgi:hypothetical protein
MDHSRAVREAALLTIQLGWIVVNLGDDADTVGAVYGQIAGAFYGASGIPEHWKQVVSLRPLLVQFATELHLRASGATEPSVVCNYCCWCWCWCWCWCGTAWRLQF